MHLLPHARYSVHSKRICPRHSGNKFFQLLRIWRGLHSPSRHKRRFCRCTGPNPPFPGRYALINGGFSGSTSTKGYKFGDKVTVSINNPILVLGDSMSIFSSWSIFHSRNGNIEPIINNSSTQDNTVSTQNSSIFDSVFTYTIQAGDAGKTVLFQPNLVIVPKNKWPVTVVSADTTMGTVSGSGNYCKQSPFSIHAFPNPGYVFHQWESITEGSEPTTMPLSETETKVVLTDEKPVTIKAHFRYENKAIVTVSSDGHGSVSSGGVIPINTPFTISATPAPGTNLTTGQKTARGSATIPITPLP